MTGCLTKVLDHLRDAVKDGQRELKLSNFKQALREMYVPEFFATVNFANMKTEDLLGSVGFSLTLGELSSQTFEELPPSLKEKFGLFSAFGRGLEAKDNSDGSSHATACQDLKVSLTKNDGNPYVESLEAKKDVNVMALRGNLSQLPHTTKKMVLLFNTIAASKQGYYSQGNPEQFENLLAEFRVGRSRILRMEKSRIILQNAFNNKALTALHRSGVNIDSGNDKAVLRILIETFGVSFEDRLLCKEVMNMLEPLSFKNFAARELPHVIKSLKIGTLDEAIVNLKVDGDTELEQIATLKKITGTTSTQTSLRNFVSDKYDLDFSQKIKSAGISMSQFVTEDQKQMILNELADTNVPLASKLVALNKASPETQEIFFELVKTFEKFTRTVANTPGPYLRSERVEVVNRIVFNGTEKGTRIESVVKILYLAARGSLTAEKYKDLQGKNPVDNFPIVKSLMERVINEYNPKERSARGPNMMRQGITPTDMARLALTDEEKQSTVVSGMLTELGTFARGSLAFNTAIQAFEAALFQERNTPGSDKGALIFSDTIFKIPSYAEEEKENVDSGL